MSKLRARKQSKNFDKYDLYRRAVQSPDHDVKWMRKVYKDLTGLAPVFFREDFCGTGLLSTEWVKLSSQHVAWGLDINPEPMEYGRLHYLAGLSKAARGRVELQEKNVLGGGLPKADIVAAQNFSYFVFRERTLLLRYFRNVRRSLRRSGIFVMDVFGGSDCQGGNTDVRREPGFTYYWEQDDFDPVTNHAHFHIHFRVGRKLHRNVFSYHWRMWTIPELRELLAEAGFRRSHVYWEGTNRKGLGSGVFSRTETGESCEGWIAYVVAEV